jgi:hypothetical protein
MIHNDPIADMVSDYNTKLSTTCDSKEYSHYTQVLDVLEELQLLLLPLN